MRSGFRVPLLSLFAAGLLIPWGTAHAQTSVDCCTNSSDFGELEDPTDPAQLQAEFTFQVTSGPVAIPDGDLYELALSVENQTPVSGIAASFNINAIFLNGELDVLSLTLVSVTDAGAGDVTASWENQAGTSSGAGHVLEKAENIGGFDDFRFSLWVGTGINNPSVIQPGETSAFVLSVLVPSGFALTEADFEVPFVNPRGRHVGDNVVAAKFVSCYGTDCSAPDDSAFGGSGDAGAEPAPGPVCEGLAEVGASCDQDTECCSNKCRGREGRRTCK